MVSETDIKLRGFIKELKEKNTNSVSVFKINNDKLIVVMNIIRTAVIIDDDFRKTKKLLDGYLLTKNAGKIGRAVNRMVIIFCSVMAKIPQRVFPYLNITCSYQLVSWRQGIRYRFVNLKEKYITDYSFENESNAIKNEIEIRLNYGKLMPISKLIEYDVNGKYFIQKYECSNSVNTLTSKHATVYECVMKTFDELQKMYSLTQTRIDYGEYTSALENKVFLSKKIPENIIERIKIIKNNINIQSINKKIILVTSHGDLNLGNILVKHNNSIVIIDWERSRTNSLTHDFYNLFWFMEYIHTVDIKITQAIKFDLQQKYKTKSISIEDNIENEYVYYLERVLMWIDYSNSTNKWLVLLTDILEKRMNK